MKPCTVKSCVKYLGQLLNIPCMYVERTWLNTFKLSLIGKHITEVLASLTRTKFPFLSVFTVILLTASCVSPLLFRSSLMGSVCVVANEDQIIICQRVNISRLQHSAWFELTYLVSHRYLRPSFFWESYW